MKATPPILAELQAVSLVVKMDGKGFRSPLETLNAGSKNLSQLLHHILAGEHLMAG